MMKRIQGGVVSVTASRKIQGGGGVVVVVVVVVVSTIAITYLTVHIIHGVDQVEVLHLGLLH